jgi:hypothetical protein
MFRSYDHLHAHTHIFLGLILLTTDPLSILTLRRRKTLSPWYYLFIYLYLLYNNTSWLPGVARVFIYPNLLSEKRTYNHSYIQVYTRFLYIHIVMCVPSLVEIALGVPELCLSVVIYHRILHWPETQKFRYFTVMWHRSWSGRFTYLNTNGRMFVCMF